MENNNNSGDNFMGINKNSKVLLASAEVEPFAKTGGLADVAGALPKELKKLGVDIKIIMPKYKLVDKYLNSNNIKPELVLENLNFNIENRQEVCNVFKIKTQENIEVFFIDNSQYFDRSGIYGDKNGDYPDNSLRFSCFCAGVLEALKKIDWMPDIIHCNDWHTALIPFYLEIIYKNDKNLKHLKTIYSIHNLAYQGLFSPLYLPELGIPKSEFTMDKLEFYDQISLMKAGIIYSDIITTVSPQYAKEIQTAEFGCGLEGVLKNKTDKLYGILNGIDYDIWNPEIDKHISANYTYKNIQDKTINKQAIKKKCDFKETDKDIPLIGIVSRLTSQKGFDLLEQAIDNIMKMELQIVSLGVGEEKYHILFENMMKKHPKHIKVFLKYDALFAQEFYAGCDMFLMPSYYEPCGLGQLISLKYGTIPVVNKKGGLADTVEEFNTKNLTGTGFLMKDSSAESLESAIKKATTTYNNKNLWKHLVKNAMQADFSWTQSAKKYLNLYTKLITTNIKI
jgi:starch synthase